MIKNVIGTLYGKYIGRKIKHKSIDSAERTHDVIIHVGAPKTGTSAIQNFLLETRKKLEPAGIYYPAHTTDENGVSGGHYTLGKALKNKEIQEAKDIYADYLAEAHKKSSILLLSSESLYSHPESLGMITGTLGVKIIIFARDPVESIISLYNQGVKRHFQTKKLQFFCENILQNKNYQLDVFLNMWKNIYGEKNVELVKYRKSDFLRMPIQRVFLKKAGLPSDTIEELMPDEIKVINQSYGKAELELKRILNHVLDQKNQVMNKQIDLFFQKSSDFKNEVRTGIEVTKGTLEALKKKFDSDTTLYNTEYDARKVQHEVIILMDTLEKEQKHLYLYIQQCFKDYILKHQEISYDIYFLSVLLRHTFDASIYKEGWFVQTQLDNMLGEKYAKADFLRDIATVFLKKGDLESADIFISKAMEIRPNGEAIKKIKEDIVKRLTRDLSK